MRITYEDPLNYEKEHSFLESFKSLARDIPKGIWKHFEAPDYVLDTPTRRYGLEITTVMVKSIEGQAPLAAIRHAQTQCLYMARKLAIDHGILPLAVEVGFRDNRRPIDSKKIAQELVTFVEGRLHYLDDTGSYYCDESGLPDIEKVRIQLGKVHGQKWLDDHRWSRDHLNVVTLDPIALLQEAIYKKEEKLQDYLAKCDECWLLVGVDEWTAPEAIYLTPRGTDHVYRCGFSRLFFLRNIEGLLVEMKVTTLRSNPT